MPPILIFALIFLVLLVASLPLIKLLVSRYIVRKAQQTHIAARDPLLAGLETGKPALIYFTSPGCGPCRTTQKPIIQKLQQARGDTLQILTVNIDEQLDDALRWGVMKVPRTFILDHNLRPYASNLDVAKLDTLQQQIDEAERNADLPAQPLKIVGGVH
jgi:thiol-disulfide isomerase/thioredoxin